MPKYTYYESHPEPRTGLLGALDQFIGPGATSAELILQFGASLFIGALCWINYRQTNDNPTNEWVVLLLGMDLIGGIVTNATSSAKRWYHRDSQGFVDHMGFIALHGVQIGLLAWLYVPNDSIQYFCRLYGALSVAAAIVLCVPLYLQRPTALAITASTILVTSMKTILPPTESGMEWFVPLLFLKLLVSHLTTEVPFVPEQKKQE